MHVGSHHSCRFVRSAFLGLSALLFAACGGGGGASPTPSCGTGRIGQVVLACVAPDEPGTPAAPAPGQTVWHGHRTALALQGVGTGSTCVAVDPAALEILADCSSAIGRRLGSQSIRITGPGGVSTTASARVIPQRRWAGLSPDNLSASTLLITTPGGQTQAWGTNWVGLLGAGLVDVTATRALPAPVLELGSLLPLASIVQTQLAASAALALTEDGQAWAWGESRYTASGERAGTRTAAVPVQRSAAGDRLAGVVQIAGADGAMAAVLEEGAVLGWGAYSGTGSADLVDYPTPVLDDTGRPLTGIRTVVGGWSAIAALGADGRVWVWGYRMGPDGSLQRTARTLRRPEGGELEGIVGMAAGHGHVLAIDAMGQVYAAGSNDAGQLGQGNTSPVPGWVAVPVLAIDGLAPIANVVMVAAGPRTSFALDSGGRVWSWGSVTVPQIGCGVYRCNTGGNYRALPGPVLEESGAQLSGIVSIRASYDHGLALRPDGAVLIWGNGGAGLGQGSTQAPDAWSAIVARDAAGTGPLLLDPAAYPNLTERYR